MGFRALRQSAGNISVWSLPALNGRVLYNFVAREMGTSKKRVGRLERKVERQALTWLLVGLAIVLLVFLIVEFLKG